MAANHTMRRFQCATLLVATLTVTAGCTDAPRQTAFMSEVGVVEASSRELRLRLYEYQGRFTAIVASAADAIIAENDDPEIKRNAHSWKMNAVPVMQQAALHSDPLGALIDSIVFTRQMQEFFETGAGSDVFGASQPHAVAAAGALEAELMEVITASVSGESPEVREFIESWVAEHPIEDLRFTRVTTVTAWATLAAEGGASGLGAIGSMDESFKDLLDRLQIYMRDLPQQSRWQAELALDEFMARADASAFVANVDTLQLDVSDIAADFELFTAMVYGMYSSTIESIEGTLPPVMSRIDSQRVHAIAELRRERDLVTSMLRSERALVLSEVEAISQRTVADATVQVEMAANRLLLRATGLAAALLIVVALIGAVLVVVVRRQWGSRRLTPGSIWGQVRTCQD